MKNHLNKILDIIGTDKINKALIEEQTNTNIKAHGLMYSIGMFFEIKGIDYKL